MSVTSGFEMAFPLLTDELKRAMYHDFVKIREMKAPHGLKCRILGEVFSQNPYSWRIVGITTQALECFRQTNFVRASRMGVNRSHLVDRNGTYTKLLTNDHSFDQWWSEYWENDRTVLATTKENRNISSISYIKFDESDSLFRCQGFAWRHGLNEISHLRNLAIEHFGTA